MSMEFMSFVMCLFFYRPILIRVTNLEDSWKKLFVPSSLDSGSWNKIILV